MKNKIKYIEHCVLRTILGFSPGAYVVKMGSREHEC